MLDRVLAQAPAFLLVVVRCFALLMTLPLFGMRSVPGAARAALTIFMAYNVFGQVDYSSYAPTLAPGQTFTLDFLALLLGEGLIGLIPGFYITIIFSAFSTAGQFFAFQMGFSASEVYDALSQVENPLMGQYLNLIAMLIFMQTGFFQTLFLGGLVSSFKTLSAYSIVGDLAGGAILPRFFLRSLTELFANALVISLPIIGTLMLITISVGMLSKAAPQMNLLSEGFPIMLLTSFFVLTALMPSLIDAFLRCFSGGFARLERLFLALGGKPL